MAEGMLQSSPLDWSIARATMPADGPRTGRVHTDFETDATGGDGRLNRADAMALLEVTEDPSIVRRAVGVGARKDNQSPPGRPAGRARQQHTPGKKPATCADVSIPDRLVNPRAWCLSADA